MANPSTIWAQLAMPNPPAGSVPFVLSDGATIGTDVLNLNYNSTSKILMVSNGIEVNNQTNQQGVVSPITVNHAMGRATIKAGTSNVTVNNSTITAGDECFIQRRNSDATAVQLSATTGAGVITITSNANATVDVNITFMIVRGLIVTT